MYKIGIVVNFPYTVSINTILEHTRKSSDFELEFILHEREPGIFAAAFQSLIDFLISSEFLQAMVTGVISTVTVNGLLYTIKRIYNSIQGKLGPKSISKVDIKIGNDQLVLGNDLSDKSIDNAIYQFFNLEKEKLRIQDRKSMWLYARNKTGEVIISTDDLERFINAIREDEGNTR